MEANKVNKYIAGITTYQPDLSRLKMNVEAISLQVDKVLIVDNGSANISEIEQLIHDYDNLIIINNKENKGIAFAMNIIGEYAYENGYDWFLTLDQDSVCPKNMMKEYSILVDSNIGIIAPYIKFNERFIGQLLRNNKSEGDKRDSKQYAEEVLYAVSSGQLINTRIWKEADGFWDYLFIDYVDQEFCFHFHSNPVCRRT